MEKNSTIQEQKYVSSELVAWAILPFAFSKHTMSREEYISMVAKEITKAIDFEIEPLKAKLREVINAGQEALDYSDGSGKPILQEAIWSAQEMLNP